MLVKMRTLTVFLGLFIAVALAQEQKDWWETAIFYQIYPRSFKDSGTDGVGDLRGVIEKLDHLKEMGVQATWLSPIMKSPQVDFGYDISDFKDIDILFGTLEDFDELVKKAQEYDIKIIMDFVPNHSSDEHEWFVKSKAKEPGFEDYYTWLDGKECIPKPWNPQGPVPCKPPNNWQSVFYGPAWTWSWDREQFYLHQFDKGQPDLNFRNPRVKEELKDVLRFWLDRGASGFRVDAINHMMEVADFRDEPLSGWTSDPNDYGYTHHWYTKDLDETYANVREWSELLAQYTAEKGTETKVILTEAYANQSFTSRYYVDSEVNFPFNFNFIENLRQEDDVYKIRDQITSWLDNMPAGATANWVLGNHDKPRHGSRFGFERHDGLACIALTAPGVAVVYNGEEMGMVDHRDISWEDTVDPQACNGPREGYKERSRDPQRTPFQWDDTANAGFTAAGNKPWLPLHPNYRNNNLKAQKAAPKSYYKFFLALSQLRRDPILTHGSFRTYIFDNNIYSHIRSFDGKDIIVVVNWSYEWRTIDLSRAIPSIANEVEVFIAGHRSSHFAGEILTSRNLQVRAYDALVLKPKV